MRVIHLFSNKRWTGPAEPALNLCATLRALGVETDFACDPGRDIRINKIVEVARSQGVEPILQFNLSKHRALIKNWQDKKTLVALVKEGGYDIVHCHLNNDHLIAASSQARHGAAVMRSSYEGVGLKGTYPYRRMLKNTARLIEPSHIAAGHDSVRYAYPEERISVVPNAVDTERFSPEREVPDGRARLGIPGDAFVVGIVARMQTHRHYADYIEAFRQLARERENVHAVIVGRGTKQDQVALQPVREFGLEGRVHFSGYVAGDDYVGVLKAFDVKVYLVPGSDGTCRAVREAMAMGKPVIAADRGMLREIVDNEKTGWVCDGSAGALLAVLRRITAHPEAVKAAGEAAREKAEKQFSLMAQARAVLGVYESVMTGRKI